MRAVQHRPLRRAHRAVLEIRRQCSQWLLPHPKSLRSRSGASIQCTASGLLFRGTTHRSRRRDPPRTPLCPGANRSRRKATAKIVRPMRTPNQLTTGHRHCTDNLASRYALCDPVQNETRSRDFCPRRAEGLLVRNTPTTVPVQFYFPGGATILPRCGKSATDCGERPQS
jgi:hypothetical protein